jgi:hypothetical protein
MLIQGWLRLFFGITQISLATSSALLFLKFGLHPFTLAAAGSGLIIPIISRAIYKESSSPLLTARKGQNREA